MGHDPQRSLRDVAPGEPGVLLVASATMMWGYWRRPDLTASSVIETSNEHGATERWYLTGDLVAERTDGELVFLGRADHQIKLRGHRIELEAIDTVLRDAPNVREATVVVQRPEQGDDRLVGMVVLDAAATESESTSLAAVETALKTHLPRYAVPSDVVAVSALPRTSTGKVDRSASEALLDV